MGPGEHWFWGPTGFIDYIQAISGSETESRELSLSLLFLSANQLLEKHNKFYFIEDCHQIDTDDDLRVLLAQELLRPEQDLARALIDIAPFYPGGGGRPLLVLNPEVEEGRLRFSVMKGVIPAAVDGAVRDTHDLYCRLTAEPRRRGATIVWLKPVKAVRVYHGGKLIFHSLLLRKTQKRCYRIPVEFGDPFIFEMRRRGLVAADAENDDNLPELIQRLMAVVVELSEERVGGAIYIMSRETFERASRKEQGSAIRINKKSLVRGTTGELSFTSVPLGTLLQMVREDGATIISPDGRILAIGAYFDGVGGRRATAKYVCSETQSQVAAVVVSQDGNVLYSQADDTREWGVCPRQS